MNSRQSWWWPAWQQVELKVKTNIAQSPNVCHELNMRSSLTRVVTNTVAQAQVHGFASPCHLFYQSQISLQDSQSCMQLLDKLFATAFRLHRTAWSTAIMFINLLLACYLANATCAIINIMATLIFVILIVSQLHAFFLVVAVRSFLHVLVAAEGERWRMRWTYCMHWDAKFCRRKFLATWRWSDLADASSCGAGRWTWESLSLHQAQRVPLEHAPVGNLMQILDETASVTWQKGVTLVVSHLRQATATWTNGFRGRDNVTNKCANKIAKIAKKRAINKQFCANVE